MQIRTKPRRSRVWTPRSSRESPLTPAPPLPEGRPRWEVSLRPALAGPPLPRPQEAGPCDLISEAQAQQLLLVTSTMDFQRAGVRLQVVLGHLNRPAAPAIVSFGLRGGTGEGVRLERASPPWWWLPGRWRATAPAALLGSPWGSGEEAAFPCSVTSFPLPSPPSPEDLVLAAGV